MLFHTRSRFQGIIEFLLWSCGLLCGVVLFIGAIEARAARKASGAIGINVGSAIRNPSQSYFQAQDDPLNSEVQVPKPKSSGINSRSGEFVIGRLEITRIGLSVPVMSDFDNSSLSKGVGHIKGTAMPGGLGTLGLAGHRDTYFRPLRNIAKAMEIRVIDRTGTYRYVVDSTEIVTPDQVQVLDIRDRPELTLITCYPFDYIGAAPKRFIVHAHLLSATPDAQ
ncbi:hypothetical protein BH10ACI4_BH10ACI4_17800 [soil metagenome]